MREVKHSCDEKSTRYTIIDVSMLRKILYLLSAKIIRNHKHSLTVIHIGWAGGGRWHTGQTGGAGGIDQSRWSWLKQVELTKAGEAGWSRWNWPKQVKLAEAGGIDQSRWSWLKQVDQAKQMIQMSLTKQVDQVSSWTRRAVVVGQTALSILLVT